MGIYKQTAEDTMCTYNQWVNSDKIHKESDMYYTCHTIRPWGMKVSRNRWNGVWVSYVNKRWKIITNYVTITGHMYVATHATSNSILLLLSATRQHCMEVWVCLDLSPSLSLSLPLSPPSISITESGVVQQQQVQNQNPTNPYNTRTWSQG